MLKAAVLAAAFVAISLAGCTGNSAPEQVLDGDADEFSLQAGKGAIAGLLVDDRFRPLHLVDTPESEFQVGGFILLQELGLKAQTDGNGEFSFVDLEPGTYTVRAQVDDHEATPKTVQVLADDFAEATMIARRISSQGSAIITTEQTVYIDCAFDYVAGGGNGPPPHIGLVGCDGDASPDGYSSTFISDYSGYGDNVTWMVTEMLANQENRWELQMRGGCRHVAEWATGNYLKVVMENGVEATDHMDNPTYSYCKWTNAEPFQTIFFVDHQFRQEHQDLVGGAFCCGVGASFGIKALILQSAFLGAPEVDVQDYCILC